MTGSDAEQLRSLRDEWNNRARAIEQSDSYSSEAAAIRKCASELNRLVKRLDATDNAEA